MSLKDFLPWRRTGIATDSWPSPGSAAPNPWPSTGKTKPDTHSVVSNTTTDLRRGSSDATRAPSFDGFDDFRDEMDRMRDAFLNDKDFAHALSSQDFASPGLKVEETANEYRVTIELPGIDEKAVNIQARDNMLTVGAEERSQHDEGDSGHRISQRSYSRFERMVPFQTAIDPDKVTSTFSAGTLHVTLPKKGRI